MTDVKRSIENDSLLDAFIAVRTLFETLCEPLDIEDFGLQAMPDTSPPKWHLAHTTWFFETFLLKPFVENYQSENSLWDVLFNSYYNGIGEQYSRPDRGLLSRPTVSEVLNYRHRVTDAVCRLLSDKEHPDRDEIRQRVRLGVNHEQQHQELFFTDLKYSFSKNPLCPAYRRDPRSESFDKPSIISSEDSSSTMAWTAFEGGLVETGFSGAGFCFDNELPRHKVALNGFQLANRLVTNGEFAEFIADGGYTRPELWLADGWAKVQQEGWRYPLYWQDGESSAAGEGSCAVFSLYGLINLDPSEPVCHVSAYESDAYARWAGCRLPTEPELEHALEENAGDGGQFLETGAFHPRAAVGSGMQQLQGVLWAWTSSAYGPYPGFETAEGAIGEYNGKFMCNQLVLKGGSFATSRSHFRPSYRNFFYPGDRWQFTGIRLAKNQ